MLFLPHSLLAQQNFTSVASWLKALEKESNETRYGLVYALTEVRGNKVKAAKKLYQALEHSDLFVRRYAALALGEHQLDPENAIPRLCDLLKDDELEVQHYARISLTKYGKPAIPFLVDVLETAGPPFQIEYALDDLTSDVRHSLPATHATMALLDIKEGVFDQMLLQIKRENDYVKLLSDSLRKILYPTLSPYYAHPESWIKLPPDSSHSSSLLPYKKAFLSIKNGDKDEKYIRELEKGLQSSQLDIAKYSLQLLWNLLDPQADSIIASNLILKEYAISPYLLEILIDRYDKYGEPYPPQDEEYDFIGGKSWKEAESFALKDRKRLSPVFFYSLKELEEEAEPKTRLQISQLFKKYFPQEQHTYDYLLASFHKESNIKRKCEYVSLISRLANLNKLKLDWPALIEPILKDENLRKSDWEKLNLGSASISNPELYSYLEVYMTRGSKRERFLVSQTLRNNPARDSSQLDSLFIALQKESDPDILLAYLSSVESKRNHLDFDKAWFELFEKLSQNEHESVRRKIFYLLYQRFRSQEGVSELLLSVYNDKSFNIRYQAIYWLNSIIPDKEERLAFILQQILKEEDPRLQNRWIHSRPKGLQPFALLQARFYDHFKKTLSAKDSTLRANSLANCLSAHPRGEKLQPELLGFIQDDAFTVRLTLVSNLLTYSKGKELRFQNRIDFEDPSLEEALLNLIPNERKSSIRKIGIELLAETGVCKHVNFFQTQLQKEIRWDMERRKSDKYQSPRPEEAVIPVLLEALAKCQRDPLAGIEEEVRLHYQESAYITQAQYNLRGMSLESLKAALSFSQKSKERVLTRLPQLLADDLEIPSDTFLLELTQFILSQPNSTSPSEESGWGRHFLPYFKQHISDQYDDWKKLFDTSQNLNLKSNLIPILLLRFDRWEEELESLFLGLLEEPDPKVKREAIYQLTKWLENKTELGETASSDALKARYFSLLEEPDFTEKREILDILHLKGEIAELGKERTLKLFEDEALFFKDQLIVRTFDLYGRDSSYWFILLSLLGSEDDRVFYEARIHLKRVLDNNPHAAKSLMKAALSMEENASLEFVKLLLESEPKDQELLALLMPLLHKNYFETDFQESIAQLKKKFILHLHEDPSFEVKSGNSSFLDGNDKSPQLPWPPPAYTKRSMLPSHLLGSDSDTLGTILKNLTAILYESGYRERRIYRTKQGFAVLTQLERIHEDVRPWDGIDRWTQKELPPLDIGDYLSRLFMGSTGHYRVLLFIVTELEDIHGPAGPEVNAKQMSSLMSGGSQTLSKSYRSQAFKDMSVHCLIYQFEKRNGGETLLIRQSPFVVEDHLQKAGFMDKLNQFARKRE